MQGNHENRRRHVKGSSIIKEKKAFYERFKNILSSDKAVESSKAIINGLLYAVTAFFFSNCELLFGAHPLGFAFLCASSGNIIYILAGCILGSLGLRKLRWIYISAYCATVLLRIFIRFIVNAPYPNEESVKKDNKNLKFAEKLSENIKRCKRKLFLKVHITEKSGSAKSAFDFFLSTPATFDDSIAVRSLLACLSAFFAGLCTVILGGFAYFDIFGVLFAIVLAPAATLVFSGLFDKQFENTVVFQIAEAAFVFAIVYTSKNVLLIGSSVSFFCAWTAILLFCNRHSFIFAMAVSLLCGIAYSPVLIPIFLLPAIIFLILRSVSIQIAVYSACIVGILWGIYASGTASLIRFLPSILISSITFLLIEGELKNSNQISVKEKLIRKKEEYVEERKERNKNMAELIASKSCMDATKDKLSAMSESFENLSEIFFNLSDKLRRPAMLDLRRMCDCAFDKCCPHCANHDLCWGMEYSITLEIINKLTASLHMRGTVGMENIPDYLKTRCGYIEEIITEINKNCAKMTEAALKTEKTEIFAIDYEAIAKILTDTIKSEFESYSCDQKKSKQIYDFMIENGYAAQGAVVLTGRQKQVILHGIKSENFDFDTDFLRKKFSEICGCELSAPVFETQNSIESLYLSAKRKINVSFNKAAFTAKGENVPCGDTSNFIENKQDLFYALIADGMGSGSNAALTSGICSVFLEKMLSCGNKVETSLRMLNNFIRSKAANSAFECSSTIDLAEFDLINSTVSFIKSGAAPSFILRNSKIYKIESKTAPIGIIGEIDTQITKIDVRPDDVIIMVSDGAFRDGCDSDFMDFLSSNCDPSSSPSKIADMIVSNARICGSTDDISASVIKISSL